MDINKFINPSSSNKFTEVLGGGLFNRRKKERFKELLIYVVNQAEHGYQIPQTKLWKLLYFCEADFFEQNRTTISGIKYYKNRFGPTPDKKIISAVLSEISDYVKIEETKSDDGKNIVHFSPLKDYDYKRLSAKEGKSIEKTCQEYLHLSTNHIVQLAHQDTPYLGAKRREEIDFSFVDYRDDDILAEETERIEETSGQCDEIISVEAKEKLFGLIKE